MRIRSIKPEFWRSEDISSLNIEDRLLYIGLWSYVDDNGVGLDRLSLIAADLFADDLERDPPETLARVSRGLSNLFTAGCIKRYSDPESTEKRALLFVVKWDKHQRVDKPNKPRYPRPTRTLVNPARLSRNPREILARLPRLEQGNRGTEEQSLSLRERGRNRTQRGRKPARGHRLPEGWEPDRTLIQAMRLECPTVDLIAEHRKFTDYYLAAAGTNATKRDWPATWRNWRRAAERQQPNGKPRNGEIDWDAAAARAAERDARTS